MIANIVYVHLADDEWNNPLMRQVADETFERFPEADVVLVYEHAGWYLSWNRNGVCVGTANDMAVLSEEAREWGEQVTGDHTLAIIHRGPDNSQGLAAGEESVWMPDAKPDLRLVGAA